MRLIRARWLILGTIVHLFNREALIDHDLSGVNAADAARASVRRYHRTGEYSSGHR